MTSRPVGTVSRLWRFPVKSMMGERRSRLDVAEHGIVGDRWWATRDEEKGGIRGAKKIGSLMGLAASYVDEPVRGGPVPPVEITLPDGSSVRSDDPSCAEVVSRAVDRRVTMWPLRPADELDHYRRTAADHDDLEVELREMFQREPDEPLPDFSTFPPEVIEFESPPGTYYDAYPVLVLTTATLAHLEELAPDSVVDERRFRPNIVIESDGHGFVEQAWVGSTLTFGEVELDVVAPCARCVMITRAFDDLPQDRALMRTVVAAANQNLGVYATVRRTGSIDLGAPVSLG